MVLNDAKEDWSANCTSIRVWKYDYTKWWQEVWRLEEELDKDVVCSRLYSTYCSEYLTNSWRVWRLQKRSKSNSHFEIFRWLVLLAKEETVLQGRTSRLIETGRRYGMEMNVGKAKSMRTLQQPSQLQIVTERKRLQPLTTFFPFM